MSTCISIRKNEFDIIGGIWEVIIKEKIKTIEKISKNFKINKLTLIEKYCPEYKLFNIKIN